MESARKFIQVIRFAMAGSIVIYGLLIWWLPSSVRPYPILLLAMTAMALTLVVLIFVIRRIRVLPAEATLATQPQNAQVLMHWRQGYLVTYVLSEAIALYGLVLHFLGSAVSQVAPFFLAGFALITFLGPRTLPKDEFPAQSGSVTPS